MSTNKYILTENIDQRTRLAKLLTLSEYNELDKAHIIFKKIGSL